MSGNNYPMILAWIAFIFLETLDWLQSYNGAITAIATVFIGIYTIVLARVSRTQAKLTQKALDLAVKRPWLFVSGPFQLFEETWQDEFWCFVRYFVANHGEAPAVIGGVQCDFVQSPDEPVLNVIRSNDLIVNPIIGPSETRNNVQTNVPQELIGEDTLVHLEDGRSVHLPGRDKPFLLRIKIQYRGTSSKGHETAALWAWNFTLSQFEIAGGEKYNYAR